MEMYEGSLREGWVSRRDRLWQIAKGGPARETHGKSVEKNETKLAPGDSK